MKKRQFLLSAASGVCIAAAFPPFNFFVLGWFCFLPVLYAIKTSSVRQAYILGVVCGCTGIYIGHHWVSEWVTLAVNVGFPLNRLFLFGYSFCFAQAFGLVFAIYRLLQKKKTRDDLILFPVVLVTVFSLFPMIFDIHLGDSQTRFLSALQPIELTGIFGLDAIMALTNVLFYKRLFERESLQRPALVFSAILLVAWFIYGVSLYKIRSEDLAGRTSKKIGIVQPNRVPTIQKPVPEKGFSRPQPLEMEISRKLTAEGAEILIWPEGHFHGYAFWSEVREAFQESIRNMKTPLVFYDYTFKEHDEKKNYFNTTIFLNSDGKELDRYNKMKLVPFSEYMPLSGNIPLISEFLGDYLDFLTPGQEEKVVTLAGMRIVPKICYEPLFPIFVAKSIGSDAAGKVLLVQSQDGWFGQTGQPEQHIAVTVVRAVENRVPLIHVINNGPSVIVSPRGEITFKSGPFTRGGWVADLEFDEHAGGSFFSRFPLLFISTIRGLFIIMIALYLFQIRKSKHLMKNRS